MRSRRSLLLSTAVVAASCAATLAACGGDSKGSASQPAATRSIPASLRTVESASEDIIDLALQDERVQVVARATALKVAADGPAAKALRRAGAPATEIAELQRRAARVVRLAPRAELLDVALASAAAFELVPGFFERYDDDVPATVIRLDYLDFSAKLQSLKGDRRALATTVSSLDTTWSGLRPQFVAAGGGKVAAAFDEHVDAMRRLAANRRPANTQREAQHGLDLVDELEQVYSR